MTLDETLLWLTDCLTDTPLMSERADYHSSILQDLKVFKVACLLSEDFSTIAHYFAEAGVVVSKNMWRGTQLRFVIFKSVQTLHLSFKNRRALSSL